MRFWWDLTPQELYQFWQLGDVNMDAYIDLKDLEFIQQFIGSFHPAADLDANGLVNDVDLQICADNLGLNVYDYFGVIPPTSMVVPSSCSCWQR